MASKTVDKSEEVLEIDDSHYLYDDLHLSRDTMQDILDFAGYRVVFDDTKKHRGKTVLKWNVATTYPPCKKPKGLRKSAANGRDFVLCKETRPKVYSTYSEGVF